MRQALILPVAFLSTLGIAERAIAHGVEIEYQSAQAIEVTATYDSGEPMAEAQVAVFSPDNPSDPWMTGTTNEQGVFTFAPDASVLGDWEVQVRQAGHGDIVTIPVEESFAEGGAGGSTGDAVASAGGTGSFTPLQKIVVMGAVVWGFIGTALFFMSRKK
ncbi:MAG: carboxypeptidase regulatory-like domain-containing protein [Elainellaceae cyanobacterium]